MGNLDSFMKEERWKNFIGGAEEIRYNNFGL